VVLAATHVRALELISLAALRQHAADIPTDASGLL